MSVRDSLQLRDTKKGLILFLCRKTQKYDMLFQEIMAEGKTGQSQIQKALQIRKRCLFIASVRASMRATFAEEIAHDAIALIPLPPFAAMLCRGSERECTSQQRTAMLARAACVGGNLHMTSALGGGVLVTGTYKSDLRKGACTRYGGLKSQKFSRHYLYMACPLLETELSMWAAICHSR